MSAGQHEAVAVMPVGIGRIVLKIVGPYLIGHWCKSHRRSGVATVGGLYAIHAQGSDGVDGQIAQGA